MVIHPLPWSEDSASVIDAGFVLGHRYLPLELQKNSGISAQPEKWNQFMFFVSRAFRAKNSYAP
jgi:hypothetical protein